MDTLTAELLDEIRASREKLLSQEHFLEQLKASREKLLSQEHFLEQLKASREGLLSQEQLLTLVTAYRESLARQEQLLQVLSPAPPSLTVWCPSENDAEVSGLQPTLKLHTIEQTTGAPDILVRVKRTWVGRLYVNHLKQIPLVRWQIIWLWRTLHSIYNNTFSVYLGSHASKRWRPLVKLGDYVKALHLPTTKVFDAAWVDTPAPKVFPVEDQAYLVSPHDRYVFPPVYVAELGEALIYGGTNLVFVQGAVICHDLYDFERDYTSEELHGRHIIDEKKMRMRLLRHDATPEKIAVAATFVDACAPNYAHWLTEVLPRIVLFCAEERFVNVPIVVNDGLHKNIMEALFLVTGSKRHIITLPIGRAIKVDVMYLTSVAGYVPFERRKKELSSHSHGLFSPGSFEFLCNHMSGLGGTTEVEAWPEKIYLRRNSGARKVTNAFEIEKLLCARGYVIVEPEKLTFSQQVQLFSNAKTIVGSSGAALANILFAPQGAKIFILISKFPDTSYWYWQNMACASGKTVSYILGEVAARDHSGIHADFTVNLQHVLQELGEKS